MKKIIFFLCLGLFLTVSCNKQEITNKPYNNETAVELRSKRTINSFSAADIRHEKVAIVLSDFFENTIVRSAILDYAESINKEVILLADFFYKEVLENEPLITIFNSINTDNSENENISLCSLINEYLFDYPNLEVYIYQNYSTVPYPAIRTVNNVETVFFYDDVSSFPIYKAGVSEGIYNLQNEPEDKTIFIIKTMDFYDVLSSSTISQEAANPLYADLLVSKEAIDYINNTIDISPSSKSISGLCIFNNPLSNLKVINLETLFNVYNNDLSLLPADTSTTTPGPPVIMRGGDCSRDGIKNPNGRETITYFRVNGDDKKQRKGMVKHYLMIVKNGANGIITSVISKLM